MKAYRIMNLVILALLLYALIFPLISPLMERLFPSLWRCSYKALSGKPCSFCGLTEDMNQFLQGEERNGWNNRNFPLFVTLYFAEWAIRIPLTLASGRVSGRILPVFDLTLHVIVSVWVLLLMNTFKDNILLPLLV
jgi:hypothetical protein